MGRSRSLAFGGGTRGPSPHPKSFRPALSLPVLVALAALTFVLLGVSSPMQLVIKGAIIVAAVAFTKR